MFRESKKFLKKTPKALSHGFSPSRPRKIKTIRENTLLANSEVFLEHSFVRKQSIETEKGVNYRSADDYSGFFNELEIRQVCSEIFSFYYLEKSLKKTNVKNENAHDPEKTKNTVSKVLLPAI